ncbi:hypothetical protein NEPTK9_001636 [Candidatus Neptunochlamydia vexilliferae]|uniref:Uncharacterized protein n=1 Tax=Candidatus Neptunichlamydia vexilliferae TaxID=1651774 RepID=A0ABS0B158_9BACT|nr:hypothetical protein [Candidatus Neptunochlamydia vexilliferae]
MATGISHLVLSEATSFSPIFPLFPSPTLEGYVSVSRGKLRKKSATSERTIRKNPIAFRAL